MALIKIGIAFYEKYDSEGDKSTPNWSLLVHPSSFLGNDVRIYQIRSIHGRWALDHRTSSINAVGELVGVVHVGNTSSSMPTLDTFIAEFLPIRNDDNPGCRYVWSTAAWAIRTLAYMDSWQMIRLPCAHRELYDYMKPRIQRLRMMSREADDDEIIVIPLVSSR